MLYTNDLKMHLCVILTFLSGHKYEDTHTLLSCVQASRPDATFDKIITSSLIKNSNVENGNWKKMSSNSFSVFSQFVCRYFFKLFGSYFEFRANESCLSALAFANGTS